MSVCMYVCLFDSLVSACLSTCLSVCLSGGEGQEGRVTVVCLVCVFHSTVDVDLSSQVCVLLVELYLTMYQVSEATS